MAPDVTHRPDLHTKKKIIYIYINKKIGIEWGLKTESPCTAATLTTALLKGFGRVTKQITSVGPLLLDGWAFGDFSVFIARCWQS